MDGFRGGGHLSFLSFWIGRGRIVGLIEVVITTGEIQRGERTHTMHLP